MSGSNQNQNVYKVDIYGLIGIFGTFNNVTIDDLCDVLKILKDSNIISESYTVDDILDEITYSKYYKFDQTTRIIDNSLVKDKWKFISHRCKREIKLNLYLKHIIKNLFITI